MPVIAVELDNNPMRFNERIDAKLVTDDVLRYVRKRKRIQDRVSTAFICVEMLDGLLGVHLNQPSMARRIVVAALQGAILNVVCLVTRRRPLEHLSADCAGVGCFVASLPNVVACVPAKHGVWMFVCWSKQNAADRTIA